MVNKFGLSSKTGLFFLISSIIPLSAAYFVQHFMNVVPCILCLYQRLPFFFILSMAITIMLIKKKWLRQIGVVLCCTALIVNAGLAFFHAGVEYKFFRNPLGCSTHTRIFEKAPKTVEDIKKQLVGEGARLTIVSCDEVPLRILGLSFSGWNFVYCLSCLLLFFVFYHHIKANKNNT